MKIAVFVASDIEFEFLSNKFKNFAQTYNALAEYTWNEHTFSLVKHGVGVMESTFYISKFFHENEIDLAFQLGIAGADSSVPLGETVAIKSEEQIDLGAWDDGRFNTIFDLGLENSNSFPYQDGKLYHSFPDEWMSKLNSEWLAAVTSQSIIDDILWSEERLEMANAEIESMEGASFYYTCHQFCVPALSLRSVSNHVGIRDKSFWKINDALENVTNVFFNLIKSVFNEKS